MGGAERATGATGPTEAQEAEDVGGRFESHKGSHEEAVGGLPQSQESCGVGQPEISWLVGIGSCSDFGMGSRIRYNLRSFGHRAFPLFPGLGLCVRDCRARPDYTRNHL